MAEGFVVNAAVAVNVDLADHTAAFFDAALFSESLQRLVQLRGGDLPVLINVVQIEGLAEVFLVGVGSAAVAGEIHGGELLDVDESVAVEVNLLHYAVNLLLRHRHSAESIQDRGELGGRDFAVAVLVEFPEHDLRLVHSAAAAVEHRLLLRIATALGLR
ncbi:hypothetical protein DM860_004907 [Cuscuta australis]|uniref:Uncharacterized protein n=1 Tax=Cuscuta australis TaxID=267555 RepID=A0A328DPN4_9ASTE|nr:hypothetical protein DM860_004907 [Cuscuta australis]